MKESKATTNRKENRSERAESGVTRHALHGHQIWTSRSGTCVTLLIFQRLKGGIECLSHDESARDETRRDEAEMPWFFSC
jgi:hypothetical protein